MAKKDVRRLCTAAAESAAAASARSRRASEPARASSTSARIRRPSKEHARTKGARNGSCAGAGQSSTTATRDAPPASSQPLSRAGIELTGPGSVTGRIKPSSSAVDALASTELTTPANRTAKPAMNIPIAASHTVRPARVPRQMKTAPVKISAICACSRSRIVPPKATKSSMASDPNAANVATVASPITFSLSASMAGMTSAARPARRSAARPASRDRSHCRPVPNPWPRGFVPSGGIEQVAGGRLDMPGVDARRRQQLRAGARTGHLPDGQVGDPQLLRPRA